MRLIRSPKKQKKFRVILDDGRTVDFGQKGFSDYTIHKDAERMRRYVDRHGATIPQSTSRLTDPKKIQNAMLRVNRSSKEDWKDPSTAGFWSRWLLWSFPTRAEAVRFINKKFGFKLVNGTA